MSELDRLKDILLADERAERSALQQAINADLQARFEELPDALPDLIKRSQNDEKLARALERPLSLGIERMARTQKALLISILFPLIGPIIRRSIAETLSTLVRDMNRAVEHSISPTGLRWRWEAMRTGVPFAQVVLKHTLRYRIEHLLLVNNNGGLLVAHAANANAELADSDAVAAMLSALQDFARDAVLAQADESLSSVEVGSMTLKILRGPWMHVAVAVRGEMTEQAHNNLEELLEHLHSDIDREPDIETRKEDLLGVMRDYLAKNGQESSEAQDDAKSDNKPAPVWAVALGLVALAGCSAWLISHFWYSHQSARLMQAFAQQPGYDLQSVVFENSRFKLIGARDPQADGAAAIAERLQIKPEQIDLSQLAPQLSLAPELWLRRLQNSDRVPKDIRMAVSQSKVQLSGELTEAAFADLMDLLAPWQTLAAFDLTQLRVVDQAQIEQRLTQIRLISTLSVRSSDTAAQQADLDQLIQQLQILARLSPSQSIALRIAVRDGATPLVNQLQVAVPSLRLETVPAVQAQNALIQVTGLRMLSLSGKAR